MIENTSITPSLMLEYLFCPRFIYFMKVQNIPQNEDMRFKVREGRIIHQKRALQNKYLRKKIGVIKKVNTEPLFDPKHHINGIVDEILFLKDGTAAPLDYKYAEYKEKIFKTYRIQLSMYALMIQENYCIEVNRSYLVFTRSNNHIEEIALSQKDYDKTLKYIENILKIILTGYFPKKTSIKSKCYDCCYQNICVK